MAYVIITEASFARSCENPCKCTIQHKHFQGLWHLHLTHRYILLIKAATVSEWFVLQPSTALAVESVGDTRARLGHFSGPERGCSSKSGLCIKTVETFTHSYSADFGE